MNNQYDLFIIAHGDMVAVALDSMTSGSTATCHGGGIRLIDDIPFGHKVALRPIGKGETVIKYGYAIGQAKSDIQKGEHVHTHNLATGLREKMEYTYNPPEPRENRASDAVFHGYLRPDGRAATRNEVWVIPTVGCANNAVRQICQKSQQAFGHLCDGIVAIEHPYGCSQLGEDHEYTQKILADLVNHPNAGAVLLVSLGCENNNMDEFLPVLGDYDKSRVRTLITQEARDEIQQGLDIIGELARNISGYQRQALPVSELVVGLKCGGSDAFSGITANALCGRFSQRLVEDGGTILQTEVPEMFGAEQTLMDRAADEAVFGEIVDMIDNFKEYYIRHGQPIYENPSPGNKKGGITTLEEKSLGCVQKSGQAVVSGVLGYGEPWKTKGLNLLSGPGNDLVSVTNLLAAGSLVVLFTTGRGTPVASLVPTVKVSSNTALAGHKPAWIDFDAGRVLGECEMDQLAGEFFDYVLDVASGKELTRNEENGYRDFAIFKDGVIL